MAQLIPLADGVWGSESEFRAGPGLVYPLRMVVIRLSSGQLWLWSPVAIDDALADELGAIGEVGQIVAPNCYHHLYARGAVERYPQAALWGARGLATKRARLAFDGMLGPKAPPAWADDIEQLVIDGVPRMNETVFFHRSSKTLLVADLLFNLPNATGLMSRLLQRAFGTDGVFTSSRLWWFLIRDRVKLAASVESMLAWPFERVVMAHGDVVETNTAAATRAACARLLR